MVEIDPNLVIGMMLTGLAIGGAIVGYMIKNARCFSRIETKVNTIEKWIVDHGEKSEKGLEKLTALETEVAVHEQRLNDDRKRLDVHSTEISELQDK